MKPTPNFAPHSWKDYEVKLHSELLMPILGTTRPYIGSEKSLQRACAKVLDYLNFHWIHPPNEGARTTQAGASLKAQGMKKGAADIIILEPAKEWGYVAIELKTKGNTISEEQAQFLIKTRHKRGGAFVCYNYEAFEAVLRYCYPHKFKN